MKSKTSSLIFRLNTGLVIVMALMIVMISYIIDVQLRPEIKNLKSDIVESFGNQVTLEFLQQLDDASRIATSVAHFAKYQSPDVALYKNNIPHLLEAERSSDLIAGGGYWPEAFKFDKNTERRSFFWGRNATGDLQYYDDYNDPKGRGYHHEEWYVPARYHDNEDCYWSKSYIDPYSQQPMVTCTVSVHRGGRLLGTSTVDLKLDGVKGVIDNLTKADQQYAFLVDQHNRFIAYPEMSQVLETFVDDTPNAMTVNEFKQKDTAFSEMAYLVSDLDQQFFDKLAIEHEAASKLVSASLVKESDQINPAEAKKIAIGLLAGNKLAESKNFLLGSKILSKDAIFKEPVTASVFIVPKTFWKMVIVSPLSKDIAPITDLINKLVTMLVIPLLLAIALFWFVMHRKIFAPLQQITDHLDSSEANSYKPLQISTYAGNEIHEMANRYNSHIKEISSYKSGLETLVEKRTEELKAAMKDAEAANIAKSEFLANMSHELRTPMHAILSYADLARKKLDTEDKDKLRRFLENITTSGQRLTGLLNALLDLAKIESGNMVVEISSGNLIDNIEQSVNEVVGLLKKKNLTVELHGDRNLTADFDAKLITQVIVNLLSNAIKFSPEGGQISIATNNVEPGDTDGFKGVVEFVITDQGIGIPENELKTVFEKFVQSSKNKTQAGGTGLGLSICKEIVNAHKGLIWAESPANQNGNGTAFHVVIPKNSSE